jgi:membrane protein DedA with SNARE-associated domain
LTLRVRWLVPAALLLALILVPFVLFEDTVRVWTAVHLAGNRGWLLGALIAGLLASDLFLPVPSSIVSTSAGALLGFGPGMLASAVGMSAGAVIGYVFGATAGEGLLRRFVGDSEMQHATRLSGKYGLAALLVSRPIPVLAEASVVCAGVTRMPLARFLAVTTVSNVAISAAYAAAGAALL